MSERTEATEPEELKNHELWAALALAGQPEDRAPLIAELKRRGIYSYTGDMASRKPGYMTTAELIDALETEPEKTDRWHRLCKEAGERARHGAFPPHRVPAAFDPMVHVLTEPMDLADF